MYLDILPPYFVLLVVFLLGLIIGSFLDVVVTRFHTGKSINGRSRCLSCGHTLSWYELFPLLSYVLLRGRCRNCNGHIPVRLFLMEFCTAFLFVFVALNTGSLVELFFGLVLCSLLIVIAVYDINHMVIPHEFVFALLGVAAVAIALKMGTSFEFFVLTDHLIGACGAFLFYAGLWVVSKGRWIGLGDAKLAVPLALMLTSAETFSMIVFSFWIGAALSIVILLVQKVLLSGKHHLPFINVPLTMKSEVPFAPFMIISFLLVFFTHSNVLHLMSSFF